MAANRVAISSLANGTILTSTYAPAVGATAYVYTHDTTTPVTVYAAESGGATLTQPLAAGSNGQLPGYILGEQDVDIVASYGGNTAAAAELVPVRAVDLVGTNGLIGGPGSLGLTTSAGATRQSANYALALSDTGVIVTAAGVVVTLPSPISAAIAGQSWVVINASSGAITVQTGSTAKIDNWSGGAQATSVTIASGAQATVFMPDTNLTDWVRV